MERQQEMASKQAYNEHMSKDIAKHTGANFHDLRNDAHQELRTERVDNALHVNISQGDDDMQNLYSLISSMDGVQAEPERTSQGVQANVRPTTRTSEVQANVRPTTTSSGTQSSSTRMEESQAQTRYIRHKEKGTQATEDRTDEIEQLRRASELERQQLIELHISIYVYIYIYIYIYMYMYMYV